MSDKCSCVTSDLALLPFIHVLSSICMAHTRFPATAIQTNVLSLLPNLFVAVPCDWASQRALLTTALNANIVTDC